MESANDLDRLLGQQEPHATFHDARLVAVSLDYRDRLALRVGVAAGGRPRIDRTAGRP